MLEVNTNIKIERDRNIRVNLMREEKPMWPRAKFLSECNDAELTEANMRTIYTNEIILDFEDMSLLEAKISQLKAAGLSFNIWKTNSRGFHVHMLFDELTHFSKLERKLIRETFIGSYGADKAKASEDTFIAIENKPHFKTSKPKELIDRHIVGENKIPENILSNFFSLERPQIDIQQILKGVEVGERNNSAFKIATYLRQQGKTLESALKDVLDWNQKLNDPLSEQEIHRTVKSAYSPVEPYKFKFKINEVKRKLEFPTSHLHLYEAIESLLPLFGSNYNIVRKHLWYAIHGAVLRKYARLGRIETDTRHNVCVFTIPGKGKNEIKFFIKDIFSKIGLNYVAPTSYHAEALVGKVIAVEDPNNRRKKTKIHNYGHLHEQFIVIDEATKLLVSQKDSDTDSRNYIKTALSVPIGKNTVVKRNVDELKENTIRYDPDCSIWLLTQPISLHEWIIGDGTLRRFHLVYLNLKLDSERAAAYVTRTEDVDSGKLESLKNRFVKHLQMILSLRDKEIEYESGFAKRFNELVEALTQQCVNHSRKGYNFYNSVDFTVHNWLLNMAVIRAFSRYSTKVSLSDLELAFIDLTEFLEFTINFINKFVVGTLSFDIGWHGAKGKDMECLQWLLENGATSKDSSITTIEDYEKHISEIFGIKEEGARKRYYKHKENQWVDGSRVGKSTSKVWLAFEVGQETTGTTVTTDTGNRLNAYFEILDKYQEIIPQNTQFVVFPKIENSNLPIPVVPHVPLEIQGVKQKTLDVEKEVYGLD